MILTAKIVSSAQETSWSQVHLFSPKQEEKEKKYGSLFSIISLSQEEITSDLAAFGKEIISRLQEEYYGQEISRFSLKHLQDSVEKILEEFSKPQSFQLTLIAAVVVDRLLYLSLAGQGKVFLLRKEKLAAILSSTSPKLVSASGFIKNNDLFVLGTNAFFQVVNSTFLFRLLKNNSPKKAVEALAPLIHQQKQTSQIAAVIAKIKFLQPKKIYPRPEAPQKSASRPKSVLAKFISRPHLPQLPKFPKPLLQKTFSLLKKPFQKVEPIYLKAEKQKQKKTMLSVGLILIFLLLISVVFGAFKRVKSQKQEKFNQIWQEIEYRFDQGKALVEINPSSAKENLQQAADLISQNKQEWQKEKKFQEMLAAKEKSIQDLLQQVKKEYFFSELPLFFNLGLIKKDLRALDLSFNSGQLFILGQDGTIVKIQTQTRASEILGKVEAGKLISALKEKIYLFADAKITQLADHQEKNVIDEELEGEIIDLAEFAGNLYVLEKSRKEIYKFPVIEQGFGRRQRWLSPKVELEPAPLAFSIDGQVWVAAQNNELKKFVRGQPEPFEIKDLDQPLAPLLDLYTDENSQFLYLLEKNRLVVIDKDGQYHSQYRWENENPEKVAADEENKKIFLIKEEKIWEINL